MREQPSRLEVIGAVLTIGVLGFWFGIGAALGSKMVNPSGTKGGVENDPP